MQCNLCLARRRAEWRKSNIAVERERRKSTQLVSDIPDNAQHAYVGGNSPAAVIRHSRYPIDNPTKSMLTDIVNRKPSVHGGGGPFFA
jgi:hypothetical protein